MHAVQCFHRGGPEDLRAKCDTVSSSVKQGGRASGGWEEQEMSAGRWALGSGPVRLAVLGMGPDPSLPQGPAVQVLGAGDAD